jgi:anti-anti-sigma factor
LLHYGGLFGLRVVPNREGVVVVELIGELDVVSMDRFERTVADLLSDHPRELLFDLTQAQFISVQGYWVMGACSAAVHVTVRSVSSLSARILALFGHDVVVVLVEPEAPVHAPG